MNLIRVTDAKSNEFAEAFEIYKSSFPIYEQRRLKDQIDALSDEDYYFEIVKDDENTVLGILLSWKNEDFVYVEHLAILQSARGKNIGTRILEHLKQKESLPIILEIDPPVDEISIKRKGFYENLGFEMLDKAHLHPVFIKGYEPYDLKVFSYPKIDDQMYEKYNIFLFNRVMQYSESEK